MKVEEALRPVQRLFLDTAPVIYMVERHPEYVSRVDPIFDRLDAGQIRAHTSPVTLAECLVLPKRIGDTQLVADFTYLVVSGPGVEFISLDARAAETAADLRVRYSLALADALQVAVALTSGCDALLTNDTGLRRVTELTVLVLDDLDP